VGVGDELGRLKVTYVATSWKAKYIRGIKGEICIHEHDSKCQIYVVLFGFLGLRPQTHTEAPPLNPAGDGPCAPQPLPPGDTTGRLSLWSVIDIISLGRVAVAEILGSSVCPAHPTFFEFHWHYHNFFAFQRIIGGNSKHSFLKTKVAFDSFTSVLWFECSKYEEQWQNARAFNNNSDKRVSEWAEFYVPLDT